MGRAGYTKNMLIGSAIAAVLITSSRLYLSADARRWVTIVVGIVTLFGLTVLPRLIRFVPKRRSKTIGG